MAKANLEIVISALNMATKELKAVTGDLRDIEGQGKKTGGVFDALSTGWGRATVALASVSAGIFAAKKALDFGKEGAQLEFARVKFDRLAASIGTTGSVLINDLREATRGLMSDAELVSAAGDLMALGLAKTHDEAVGLARASSALGMNMNQLVLTLTNQTTMRFDALGVSVDGFAEKVKKLEAAGHDANEAFKLAFLEQAEEQIARVGEVADTTLGTFQKFGAESANAWDRFKKAFGEGIEPIISGLADYLENQNKVAEAAQQLGAEFAGMGTTAQNVGQQMFELNGVLITLDELLRKAEVSERAYQNAWNTQWAAMVTGNVGEVGDAFHDATGEASNFFDQLNRNVGNVFADVLADLKFAEAGGGFFSALGRALSDGDVPVELAGAAAEAGIVASAAFAEAAGQLDMSQAAQQISDSLDIPIEDAQAKLDEFKSGYMALDQTEINTLLRVDVDAPSWLPLLLAFLKDQPGNVGSFSNSKSQNKRVDREDERVSGKAMGGFLDAPLIEVGEQGSEGLEWDEKAKRWRVIPHGEWMARKSQGIEASFGMKEGGNITGGPEDFASGRYYSSNDLRRIAPQGVFGGLIKDRPGVGPGAGSTLDSPSGVRDEQSSAAQVTAAVNAAASAAAAGAVTGVGQQNTQANTQALQTMTRVTTEGFDASIDRLERMLVDLPSRIGKAVAAEVQKARVR